MKLIKKNLLSTFIFSLIIAVSIAVYLLLPYEKGSFDRLMIKCLISSELLSLLNALIYNTASDKKNLSLAAGGYTASIAFVALSAALSILFSIYYRQAEKTYLVLLSILTAAFVIASMFIYIIGIKLDSNEAQAERASAAEVSRLKSGNI